VLTPGALHQALVRELKDDPSLAHKTHYSFYDNYEIVEEIGHGGICTIYKIRKRDHMIGGSSRAINVIPPEPTSFRRLRRLRRKMLSSPTLSAAWNVGGGGNVASSASMNRRAQFLSRSKGNAVSDPSLVVSIPSSTSSISSRTRRSTAPPSRATSTSPSRHVPSPPPPPLPPSTDASASDATVEQQHHNNSMLRPKSDPSLSSFEAHDFDAIASGSDHRHGPEGGMYFALKVIHLNHHQEKELEMLRNEVAILKVCPTLDGVGGRHFPFTLRCNLRYSFFLLSLSLSLSLFPVIGSQEHYQYF
jgi:hypothetical protein